MLCSHFWGSKFPLIPKLWRGKCSPTCWSPVRPHRVPCCCLLLLLSHHSGRLVLLEQPRATCLAVSGCASSYRCPVFILPQRPVFCVVRCCYHPNCSLLTGLFRCDCSPCMCRCELACAVSLVQLGLPFHFISFHLGLSRCRVPSGWHALFCLAPIFLWSFCVDAGGPVCTVVGVLRAVLVECMSCVWQHVCASGQWMCLRLSSVRLLSHYKSWLLSEPFHSRVPSCVSPRPHVLHVPERASVCPRFVRPGLIVRLTVFCRCAPLSVGSSCSIT